MKDQKMTDENQNNSKNYSIKALLAWMDSAGKRGLMNKNTAIVKKVAVVEILVSSKFLQASEENDVRKLDIDDVFTRYMNSNPNKHRPDTMKTYKSRLKSAIELFVRYTDDPLTFSVNPPKQKTAKKATAPKPTSKSTQSALIQQPSNVESQQNQRITTPLPVLISDGNTITIQNFPLNITEEEADAICSVINGFVKKPAKNNGRKLIEKQP